MSMKRYKIEITDCGERETVYFKGHNAEHAEERFVDQMVESGGFEGIKILSVTRHYSESERITRKFARR